MIMIQHIRHGLGARLVFLMDAVDSGLMRAADDRGRLGRRLAAFDLSYLLRLC